MGKTLRNSIRRATRQNLQFVQDIEYRAANNLYRTYQEEVRNKTRIEDLPDYNVFPQMQSFGVLNPKGELLSFGIIYIQDDFAAIPIRYSLRRSSRPAEFLDYNIIMYLIEKEVKKFERGFPLIDPYKQHGLDKYWSKFMPVHLESTYSIKIP